MIYMYIYCIKYIKLSSIPLCVYIYMYVMCVHIYVTYV